MKTPEFCTQGIKQIALKSDETPSFIVNTTRKHLIDSCRKNTQWAATAAPDKMKCKFLAARDGSNGGRQQQTHAVCNRQQVRWQQRQQMHGVDTKTLAETRVFSPPTNPWPPNIITWNIAIIIAQLHNKGQLSGPSLFFWSRNILIPTIKATGIFLHRAKVFYIGCIKNIWDIGKKEQLS
jgi:hypothetical protein